MAGIYIPGMEMPKSCRACQFATQFFDGEDVCALLGTYVSDTSREDDCPLVPVPDHGDLIDRDLTRVLSWSGHDDESFDSGVCFAFEWLDGLPVVIPADPEEKI